MTEPHITTHSTKHGTCYEVINRDGNVEMRTWDESMAKFYLEMLVRLEANL